MGTSRPPAHFRQEADELTLTFVVPGDLNTPTGGYRYDRRIIQELRAIHANVQVIDIGDHFPFPSESQRRESLRRLSRYASGCPLVIDGLAYGVLPEVASLGPPVVALVHLPLALDPGLNAAQAALLRDSERDALAGAGHVIATSKETARILHKHYAVPSGRISVARPGNDPFPPASGGTDGKVHLVCAGSIVPVKGYDVLVAALSKLSEKNWRLTIAGDCSRDPVTAAQIDGAIRKNGLHDRITLLGAVSASWVHELLATADIFVLASRFEAYGMALTEAIAHGVPVISTATGAIPDTLPEGTGVLVPPNDIEALARALDRLLASPAERSQLAANARAAARKLPRWSQAARVFLQAVKSVDERSSLTGGMQRFPVEPPISNTQAQNERRGRSS